MTGHAITELFAWVVDDPTGKHSICAFMRGDGNLMQAVTSKRATAEMMRPAVEEATKELGLPILLLRFALAETVDVA